MRSIQKKPLTYIFIANIFLFIFLLLKNPFSDRNLIPNFEPYPDTIHYINPARSFVSGQGFQVVREGRAFAPSVPLLYSITLIPFFLIKNDPRMFYFGNLLLAFTALFLFFQILKKVSKNIWIIGFSLFLYVTNYFLYWYPNLAMAENLMHFLFIAGIYLLLLKVNLKTIIFASVIGIGFYATKYAAAPLTIVYFLLYGIKIFIENKKIPWKNLLWYGIGIGVVTILFFGFEYITKGRNIIATLLEVTGMMGKQKVSFDATGVKTAIAAEPFSILFIPQLFPQYIKAILGNPARFLWDYTPIVPKYIAIFSILGFITSLLNKNLRFFTFSLLLLLFSQILFMSTFYAFDMRYIYHAVPTMILGFALFLIFLSSWKFAYSRYVFFSFVFCVLGFYFFTNMVRLKKQIMLNLKYRETPWYYISVLKLNEYFSVDPKGKKPIVISAMNPYYVDFFKNANYSLLPLSIDQEFRGRFNIAWGKNDYSDLIKLYRSYLNNGYRVYIHNYGLGNEGYLKSAYHDVEQKFQLQQVASGCYNACNIYRLNER
jgi:hypothetical protein